ncbi:whirlin isoform X4 [Microplitis mediator]|uniref:whirlin isoform X4 n=1 Tax=Microplitis mediator TaxID=375433 RepID=UPI0025569117|nr:whirlin isoform X4 [Microplitis mediator]
MASSTEDYGSELQELQWGGGGGGGGSSTHFLRSSTNLLRNTGGSSTVGYYEAEDLEPIGGSGSGGGGGGGGGGSGSRHIGQNRGYYSPPGTSYTIVERPPSAPHHHSSHATPYRHRSHTTSTSGAISPEQVLRIFNNGVAERRQNERRTPASSPASVSALRGANTTSYSSSSSSAVAGGIGGIGGIQTVTTSPTSQSSSVPQALSLQELTVRTITMTRDPPDSHHGFGICVKGGKDAEAQSGVGVYISRVEEGSVAERAGLRPGDTILEVNGTPFRAVTHEEALKMLKSCRTLSMTVRGPALDPRCRGGHPIWSTGSGRQQSCSWMDRQGRPASPPPLHPRDSRHGSRTRKVELCIEPGQSLGLMIRGGLEYGLGIYVTGVDKDSVADRVGLLVGDQIIEVNGTSFEEATHDEAVEILKTNKRMSLVIRDVGKVPHSCTTSRPVVVPRYHNQTDHDPQSILESPGNHPPSPTNTSDWRNRGVHTVVSSATAAMVEEKARVVLARSERAALTQLIGDYRNRRLNIEDLVANLADLLNTQEKLTLLTELREIIDGKDRVIFDDLVYRPRTFTARRKGDRAHSDLIVTPSIHDLSDYDDEIDNDRGRRHSSPGGSRGNPRDYSSHHHLHPDNLESDGGCEGSDVEMIGNGRRDRDTEDEDEGREERSSEGGSVGGFGGWRSHLLGGLTQRVKSWYWGARPLELAHKLSRSFDMQEAQLLEEGGATGGTGGNPSGNGPPRRHHSAQRLTRNDIADRREKDGSALVVPDHQGNLRITVKKTKSILGIAIEGGANTKHPLPRIINIHDNGAAFEAGGLEVGQLILQVDGHKVEGLHHQEVARLIAESFARRDRNEIEFLVVEAKKSNLEPKPTALIFLEA